MPAYPASCIFMHHLLSDVQSLSDAQGGLIERVRGAHVSRYYITIQDHAGAVRGAGVASVPSRLPDG